MKVKINECQKIRNEAHKLWLDLEKRFSSTSVGAADGRNLNKMRRMILTAKKMKRNAVQMKETISSLDEEVEVLIKKRSFCKSSLYVICLSRYIYARKC